MQARAPALDRSEEFPEADIALLRDLGMLAWPLPAACGGVGLGTDSGGTDRLFQVLRLIGRGNLAVGRLFEAHVNALRLIADYGDAAQIGTAAQDAQDGLLFGLWVTDPPGQQLAWRQQRLFGTKSPCSGAGHLRRALVTADVDGVPWMAAARLDGTERIAPMRGMLHGMRASSNGSVTFDGTPLDRAELIGQPGDYLREPQLSTGAWRTMAVTLGGLDALVDAVRDGLRSKGHDSSPLQQERFGQLLIAQETAALWTLSAARRGEAVDQAALDRVAYVNLARIAVEHACLDAIQLAQRAIGFGAFIAANPLERLLRDLATYLRQPAPDAVLTEAAAHRLATP